MTAIEEIQPTDIYQINGNVEYGFDETETIPLDPTLCNSRLFCTKRQQYLDKNQTDTNEQPGKEILICNVEMPIENLKLRSLSSPPPSLLVNDENDSSIKIEDLPKKDLIHQKQPLPIIHSGYQRKKAQSIQLTHLNENNSSPKKTVRFADDFGLDLSQMKVINTDELPHVPNEAFKDLKISNDQNSFTSHVKIVTYMEPQFDNPIYNENFNDRVSQNKIVLEQANAIDNRIYGTIRLISFGLNKQVKIHLSTDNWISFRDYDATYINNSYDGIYDRFSFIIEIDRHRVCIGSNIQFCICYQSFGGQEYWDNNYQKNYRFNCYARTIPDYNM